MKSKNVIAMAALAMAVGLAGFATTGCGLDVPASFVVGDTVGRPPGFDDGESPGDGEGSSVVPLNDSELELEGSGR